MKKITLFTLSIALTLSSLAQQYKITADISGFPDGTKFLLKDLDVDAIIDSAVIRNHSFRMKGSLTEPPQSLWLYSNYNNNFYYIILLIGNDTISIKGDIKDFPFDLSVTGSLIEADKDALSQLTKEQYKLRTGLMSDYFALKGDSAEIKGAAILKKIQILDSTNTAVRRGFIHDHPDTYASLQEMFFLRRQIGHDSLRVLYASLTPALQQSRFGLRIANYLRVGDPVKKGDPMADFEAFDKEGKLRRPSEYKGQYVLLDFSTTYCGPCMQSVADMKKLSAGYAGRLKIVSLSGDGGKNTWLTGMERDRPDWLSLWDGKGIYGEAMLKYGVTGFPTFCLVDPDGKIVRLWTGYGKNADGSGTLETEVGKMVGK